MKTSSAVVMMGLLLFMQTISANAQQTANNHLKSIQSYPISISYFKTTNIIFSHAIVGVDRGSKDVLVQKANGAENILQVKASKQGFPETNITAITADGKLNSFVVSYAKEPPVINIQISESAETIAILLSPEKAGAMQIHAGAKRALKAKKNIFGVSDKRFGVKLEANGIYIQDSTIFLRAKIDNKSGIGYDIDQLRFFVRDTEQAKRTAIQEREIRPVYIENNISNVAGHSDRVVVFAIPKLTLPDEKHLTIQLIERGGGRHLELKIRNKNLLKAAALPSY